MTPNKRRLGTTDLEITTVGFGAWAIGGGGWAYGWGPQDDAGSVASIRHAVVMTRVARRSILFGEMEAPADPDDLIMHRATLEQMLEGTDEGGR